MFMWNFMKIMNINTKFIILSVYGWVLGKLATRLHNRPFKEKGMTKFHEFMLVKVWPKKSKLTRKVKGWPRVVKYKTVLWYDKQYGKYTAKTVFTDKLVRIRFKTTIEKSSTPSRKLRAKGLQEIRKILYSPTKHR